MSRKQIDKLVEEAKGIGARGLAWLALGDDGAIKSSFAKFMSEEKTQELIRAMNASNGDLLLFAADRNKIVWEVLGALRLSLAKKLDLIDESRYDFLWVVDFPLFEWSDEQGRYLAMHHPFTMPNPEDIPLLDSQPEKVRALAYDFVCNGIEVGGGSIRIHDEHLQEKMFQLLGFTPERAQAQFGFLINAFKYGAPPHGGLAFGLDRFVSLMAGLDSIRDCIAFPKNNSGRDVMLDAPGELDPKQLEELQLTLDLHQE